MNLSARFMPVALALLCASVVWGETPPPTLYTLLVVRPLPDGVKIPNSQERTYVGILLPAPEKSIVGVDLSKSTIEEFVDDKGTKLFVPKDFNKVGISSFPLMNKAKDKAVVNFLGNVAPAERATSIRLKAKVALKCSTGETVSVPIDMKFGLGVETTPDTK